MMDSIRAIATAICVAMAVTGILSILIPGKSMEKTMQLVVGVFFLASMVLPFVTQDFAFSFEALIPASSQVEATMAEATKVHMASLTEENIEQELKLLLDSKNISAEKIEVFVNIAPDNRITITKLYIVLETQQQSQAQEVSQMVEDMFGIKPEVVVAPQTEMTTVLQE